MYYSPRTFRFLLNIWGPYFGAGIKIDDIREDWHYMRVSMKLRWFNRNAMGVHFGGSLYSMTDPHLVLMHMQLLGPDYIVWDKSAAVEFLRPGKGKVIAEIALSDCDIENIRREADNGKTSLPRYDVEVKNDRNKVVARISKTLYIKKKTGKKPMGKRRRGTLS